MGAFEDLVVLEFAERPATLTLGSTGYDGDPNLSVVAKVNGAPVGSTFLEQGTGLLWQKLVQADPASWVQVGGGLKATTAVMQYYVDGTSGVDTAGNGLDVGTPVKTLQYLFTNVFLARILLHDVVVNCVGTLAAAFDLPSIFVFPQVWDTARLIFDGGDGLTQLAGPFTATSSAVGSVTVSGSGWTDGEHRGHLVEITSGPQVGTVRNVHDNVGDVLSFGKEMTDPGLANFRTVRPETTVTAGWDFYNTYKGHVHVQRMHFDGGAGGYLWAGTLPRGKMDLTLHVAMLTISDCDWSFGTEGVALAFDEDVRDPATPSTLKPLLKAGFSTWNDGTSSLHWIIGRVSVENNSLHSGSPPYITGGGFNNDGTFNCWNGFFIESGSGEQHYAIGGGGMGVNSGWAVPKISNVAAHYSGSGAGLVVEGGFFRVGPIDISYCAGSGVEVHRNGALAIDGALSGVALVGSGCWIKSGGQVSVASWGVPTISGNAGEISFDGEQEHGTWAAVAGGEPLASAEHQAGCYQNSQA